MGNISVLPCRRTPTSDAPQARRSLMMEAWSDGLARLPASFYAKREELLALMRKDAILYESPTQPVLSRDGSTARWILNSLQVTMTARGAELAGRCILELLKGFEGRQLATFGLT